MKTYFLQFGSGDPRQFGGMNATFLLFKLSDGTNIAPPGITEIPTSTGIHYFNWGTTTPIAFLADAATTSPGAAARYVAGSLDPSDRSDEYATTLIAIGTSSIALGTSAIALGTSAVAVGTSLFAMGVSSIALGTSIYAGLTYTGQTLVGIGISLIHGLSLIGTTGSTFGGTGTDPIDLFGYLKRVQENLEGNQSFVKSTGVLTILNRGSSYTIQTKTITNSVSSVIKS